MPFIFSNDKPHSFFKNPSTRHLTNNGLEMKENEISKWQIKEGLLLMFNTLRGPLFGTFLPFHVAPASLFLTKKRKITQKTTDWWRMGVLFSQTEKKNPQIITAKMALWVTELVSGCDKCFSFWTCQKKMNLRCTAGHLGCWASALCLNTPQAFHQRGTNAEHRL